MAANEKVWEEGNSNETRRKTKFSEMLHNIIVTFLIGQMED